MTRPSSSDLAPDAPGPEEIRARVEALAEATDPFAEDTAWSRLRDLGPELPAYLAAAYATTQSGAGRASLVHHAIPYGRVSEEAVRLGLVALTDRSGRVRRAACALLAYSLRRNAIPALEEALHHQDGDTRDDAYAALVAIDEQNHHLFRDRDATGRIHWVVNPEDAPAEPAPAPTGAIQRVGRWLFRD